jgi:hypothetical protein
MLGRWIFTCVQGFQSVSLSGTDDHRYLGNPDHRLQLQSIVQEHNLGMATTLFMTRFWSRTPFRAFGGYQPP